MGQQTESAGHVPELSDEITVLFTDIEESTKRWEQRPDEMSAALRLHDNTLRTVAAEHHGDIMSHMGDGMAVRFETATAAIEAAVAMQLQLQALAWPNERRLVVRMGIHTGEARLVQSEYRGPTLNKTARVADLANGDQILVSSRTAGLSSGCSLRSMGTHMLKGIGYEDVCLVEDARLITDNRPLRSAIAQPRTALPTWLTPLIGRASEQEQILQLLGDHRLVTLKGPGGVGKTRLAVAAAQVIADKFADGVAFCDLAAVVDGTGVEEAVASAIGARKQPGMTLAESIESYVGDREMIVVVDNCEHVLPSLGSLAGSIFRLGASRVLATSREPLRINGEQVIEIGPLEATTDAVKLFIQRASDRDASFNPSSSDTELISEICGLVDGIPLAIELAAARLRVLSVAELHERMDDRFAVLRNRKDSSRHGGLRKTIEWSHEQLDDEEATLFRRLSVFAGGFDLRAIESICSDDVIDAMDILELTSSLVDKSLLTRKPGAGHVRFRLLETIREFGLEQLIAADERDLLEARHASYYAQLSADMSSLLASSKEAEVWEQLDLDWDNVRRGFSTLLQRNEIDLAVEMTLDLAWFATFAMRFEVFAFAEQLLASASGVEAHPMYGELFGVRALLAYFTADPLAADYAMEALAIDPIDSYGFSRGALSAVYLNNSLSPAESDALTLEWVDIASGQLPFSRVWAEGMRTFHLGTYVGGAEAKRHGDNIRRLADEFESPSFSALASWAEGMATVRDDIGKAEAHWQEGLETAASLGPNHLVTHLITGLRLHLMVGFVDPVLAAKECISALQNAVDQHYLAGTSHLFGVVGICLARAGKPDEALVLLNTMIAHGHQPRSNARQALMRALGPNAESMITNDGPSMSISDAATFALEQLGEVAIS